LGQNFVAMDSLEWLARMTDHIPDPGKHRTLFYAHFANVHAEIALPRSRELARLRRSQPRSAAAPRPGRRKCGGKLEIVAASSGTDCPRRAVEAR